MTQTQQKIGFQHVGSFLRPDALKQARAAFANGQITADDLTAVEDTAITTLVAQQVAAGLDVVTDGEFRRSYWHLDNFWGFDGVARIKFGEGYQFAHEETRDDSAHLIGPLGFDATTHPLIREFKFLKAVADRYGVAAKVTLPSPAQFFAELVRGKNATRVREFYAQAADFHAAIQQVYHDEILALYAAGARTIQLDDCTWGMLVDPHFGALMAGHGVSVADLKTLYLTLNNGALADLPADLVINTHVCRGNYHSDWAATGGYDLVADELLGQENVASYFLEYDSDRAGGFAPLAKVSGDKRVVLGLITTKTGELEDQQTIIDRIYEAAQYLPLDRLWLSTQCGFASTEEGNVLTEAQQWEKLALVREILTQVWGDEA